MPARTAGPERTLGRRLCGALRLPRRLALGVELAPPVLGRFAAAEQPPPQRLRLHTGRGREEGRGDGLLPEWLIQQPAPQRTTAATRTCCCSHCRRRAGRPAPRPLPPPLRAAPATSVPNRRGARRCRAASLRASAPIAAAEGCPARLPASRRSDSAASSGSDASRRRSARRLLPLIAARCCKTQPRWRPLPASHWQGRLWATHNTGQRAGRAVESAKA